jgi:hypothetical protein
VMGRSPSSVSSRGITQLFDQWKKGWSECRQRPSVWQCKAAYTDSAQLQDIYIVQRQCSETKRRDWHWKFVSSFNPSFVDDARVVYGAKFSQIVQNGQDVWRHDHSGPYAVWKSCYGSWHWHTPSETIELEQKFQGQGTIKDIVCLRHRCVFIIFFKLSYYYLP